MMLPSKARAEARDRIHATEQERTDTMVHLRQGTLLQVNAAERVEKRKARLLSGRNVTPLIDEASKRMLTEQPVPAAPEPVQRAFERQIGGKETQPCWFLTRGAEVRRSIGRVHIRNDVRRTGWGTGFLIAPRLLVTNQHVLDSYAAAAASRVEFDYEETFEGGMLETVATFDLDPATFFVCSPAEGGLDYAVVAVAARSRMDCPCPDTDLADFGYHPLVRSEGKLLKGELINTVHHPEGQPRQVTLRENRLTAIEDAALLGTWMHYETDTEQGSSGAPLYNNQWEVVGIHHAGVEKRDAQGRVLAVGGGLWSPEMGDRQKWWEANEGLRISRFIADLEAQVAAIRAGAETGKGKVVSHAGYDLFQVVAPTGPNPPSSNPAVAPGAASAGSGSAPAKPASTPSGKRYKPE